MNNLKEKEKNKNKNKDFFYWGNTFLNFFVYFCKTFFLIKVKDGSIFVFHHCFAGIYSWKYCRRIIMTTK